MYSNAREFRVIKKERRGEVRYFPQFRTRVPDWVAFIGRVLHIEREFTYWFDEKGPSWVGEFMTYTPLKFETLEQAEDFIAGQILHDEDRFEVV